MKIVSHASAKPSHYNKESEHYDEFNEKNSQVINHTIETILKKHKVKTVLDLTCGTGSQVLYLAKRGYGVVGSDINAKMLSIARSKAKKEKLKITFLKSDMRRAKIGTFDAVITIFNAVGHLTKVDFETAMRTIHAHLKDGGIYIFDIFNLHYLLHGDNITKLTIDWQENVGTTKIRTIQYSTIDKTGILASYTTSCVQKDYGKPKIAQTAQTLQVFSAAQLKEMLQRNGFQVVGQCAIDGSKFDDFSTDRIVMIAQKQ